MVGVDCQLRTKGVVAVRNIQARPSSPGLSSRRRGAPGHGDQYGSRQQAVENLSGSFRSSRCSSVRMTRNMERSCYSVRLNETLASASVISMKITRNERSLMTAERSAPLKRIDLIALTEWVSGL